MNRKKEFTAAGTGTVTLIDEELRAGDSAISVQITSPGTTVTLTYEVSNDRTNWVACPGVPVGWATAPTAASTSTTAVFLVFMAQAMYFRVRISTAGTGTVTGVAAFGEGWIR